MYIYMYVCIYLYAVLSAKADIGAYYVISGLPQLESLFWPQCLFELTMFRSEHSCANQLHHPGTKNRS